MNSLKLKLAIIASVFSAISLIVLGIVSFNSSKNILLEEEQNAEIQRVNASSKMVESFYNEKVNGFQQWILYLDNLPIHNINSQESIIENIAPNLTILKKLGALSAFFGLPNGDIIISSAVSDQEKRAFDILDGKQVKGTEKQWYKEAIRRNDIYITPVYEDELTKLPCISIVKAFYKGDTLIGVFGIDIALSAINDSLSGMAVENGELMIMDANQVPVISSKLAQNQLQKTEEHDILFNNSKQVGNLKTFEYVNPQNHDSLGVCNNIENFYGTSYSICSSADLYYINQKVNAGLINQAIMVLVLIIATIAVLYLIISRYLNPLYTIQQGLLSFFKYINYESKQAPKPIAITSNDEFGSMAKAINDNIQRTQNAL
ncbi:PDC sensor domain-containing protein, partial [Helicobacter ibis]